MSLWLFNLFSKKLIQMKILFYTPYILYSYSFYLLLSPGAFISESKNTQENLTSEKQNKNESLQLLPQNSAGLRAGRKLIILITFLLGFLHSLYVFQFPDC